MGIIHTLLVTKQYKYYIQFLLPNTNRHASLVTRSVTMTMYNYDYVDCIFGEYCILESFYPGLNKTSCVKAAFHTQYSLSTDMHEVIRTYNSTL